MYWISRTVSVVTAVALVSYCSFPALALTETTIEGTVKIPCDPSRLSDVAAVQIWSVSEGSIETVIVDSSTGAFRSSNLTEGEYKLIVIGADGKPLSPEPMTSLVREGLNTIVLTMQPPGCGEPDSDLDGVPDTVDSCPDTSSGTAVGADGCPSQDGEKSGKKDGPKGWHLTLIYIGVVAAVILVLDDDDGERPATAFQP
jgi:hypothetical protein